jgi:hypothetical protein
MKISVYELADAIKVLTSGPMTCTRAARKRTTLLCASAATSAGCLSADNLQARFDLDVANAPLRRKIEQEVDEYFDRLGLPSDCWRAPEQPEDEMRDSIRYVSRV